jgi:hypothetical protein
MATNPTQNVTSPTATNVVSLWQTNCVGLLARRRIGVRVGDTGAVCAMTGVQWGAGFDSPALA